MTDDLSKFDDYVFRPDDDGEVFAIGMVICFFFYDGTTAEKMAARLPLLDSFFRFVENQMDVYVRLDTEAPVRGVGADQILKHFHDQVANPSTTSANILTGFSGPSRGRGDPQRFYIEISAGGGGLGHVLAYVPAGWIEHAGCEAFVAKWSSGRP